MGSTRRALADALDSVLEQAASFQKEQALGQFNLFATLCESGKPGNLTDVPIPELPEWDDLTKLQHEKEMMGFYVTGHPLMNYSDVIQKYTNATAANLGDYPPQSQVKMAGLVQKVKEINTKKGDRMAFFGLEDLTGSVEVTVFSDLYLQYRDLLKSGDPLVISGLREGEKDAPKILAQEICRIDEATQRFSKGIEIRISARGADPNQILDLKRILLRNRGRLPVRLRVVIPNRSETVIKLSSISCDASEDLIESVNHTFGDRAVNFV